jgi:phage gpG-like protein|tara:strand:- start:11082 stop:11525 length:444 start_codon:yes stop_codon:yes gene_type:complete
MFSRIEFSSDSEDAERLLRAAAVNVIDLSYEMSVINGLVQANIEDHFNQEMGPVGPWTERKDNKPHKILTKTGALRQSVTAKSAASIGKLSISIKSDLVYAAVHNLGKTIPNRGGGKTKMPKRMFGYIEKQVKEKAMDVIIKGVLDV